MPPPRDGGGRRRAGPHGWACRRLTLMMGFAMLALPTTVAAPRTIPSGAKRGRQLLRTTAPATVNRAAQLNTSALRSERSLRHVGRSLRTSSLSRACPPPYPQPWLLSMWTVFCSTGSQLNPDTRRTVTRLDICTVALSLTSLTHQWVHGAAMLRHFSSGCLTLGGVRVLGAPQWRTLRRA
jgi:hypothetical protein